MPISNRLIGSVYLCRTDFEPIPNFKMVLKSFWHFFGVFFLFVTEPIWSRFQICKIVDTDFISISVSIAFYICRCKKLIAYDLNHLKLTIWQRFQYRFHTNFNTETETGIWASKYRYRIKNPCRFITILESTKLRKFVTVFTSDETIYRLSVYRLIGSVTYRFRADTESESVLTKNIYIYYFVSSVKIPISDLVSAPNQ